MVHALLRRNRSTTILFAALIACAVALGVAITAQERALRHGSAMAVDRFDLIVAAPGSQLDVLMSVVFLEPTAVGLIEPAEVGRVLAEERADLAAPIAFGDSHEGAPVIGTTAAFASHLSGGLDEGRIFAAHEEAIVGAAVPMAIGDTFQPTHGHGPAAALSEEEHHVDIAVVGRMRPTGTPWDGAIVVPVELTWELHALPNGHAIEDEAIGPPFDPQWLPGAPAIVLRPDSVAAAYGLRSKYRTERTTAFFPAEVLVQLYEVLGDVRVIMSVIAIASQVLVIAAIFAGVMAVMELYRTQLSVLRALGASRRYVFAVIWSYLTLVIVTGAVVGLALGVVTARVISWIFTRETGIALSASLGTPEWLLAASLVVIGTVLAMVPAWLIYRRPVIEGLR